jgi:hypothetical protein
VFEQAVSVVAVPVVRFALNSAHHVCLGNFTHNRSSPFPFRQRSSDHQSNDLLTRKRISNSMISPLSFFVPISANFLQGYSRHGWCSQLANTCDRAQRATHICFLMRCLLILNRRCMQYIHGVIEGHKFVENPPDR